MREGDIECDVMVIGAGMAGMASALFAARKGLSVVQTGVFGEILFASGLFDLMGVFPAAEGKKWDDPWAAIEAVRRDQPNHIYAKVDSGDIRHAMDDMLSFFGKAGLSYKRDDNYNSNIITPLGTTKQTWCVPTTMWNGVTAFKKRSPCLLIDFHGMKGFSAKQVAETLKIKWTALRSVRIEFPEIGSGSEFYAEFAARYLELNENRTAFVKGILPHIDNVEYVGFPSILGVTRTEEVFFDLQEKLGVHIFEIPGLPPSLNGLRLMEVCKENLPKTGAKTYYQKKVLGHSIAKDGTFILDVGATEKEISVKAKNIILATGRFFGRGLCEDKNHLKEPLFNLPVYQPESRKEWYKKDLLDRKGHEINNAGLEVDDMSRPVDEKGKPVFKRLFAVGSILAHHDWKRMKCGTGLAVVSSFKAVESMLKI